MYKGRRCSYKKDKKYQFSTIAHLFMGIGYFGYSILHKDINGILLNIHAVVALAVNADRLMDVHGLLSAVIRGFNHNKERVVKMGFPDIHTNFWDAVVAVPLTMLITMLFKLFHIPRKYLSAIATMVGLLISIFISHPGDLGAGLFMGGFYGSAAVGLYTSLRIAWQSYIKKRPQKTKLR